MEEKNVYIHIENIWGMWDDVNLKEKKIHLFSIQGISSCALSNLRFFLNLSACETSIISFDCLDWQYTYLLPLNRINSYNFLRKLPTAHIKQKNLLVLIWCGFFRAWFLIVLFTLSTLDMQSYILLMPHNPLPRPFIVFCLGSLHSERLYLWFHSVPVCLLYLLPDISSCHVTVLLCD